MWLTDRAFLQMHVAFSEYLVAHEFRRSLYIVSWFCRTFVCLFPPWYIFVLLFFVVASSPFIFCCLFSLFASFFALFLMEVWFDSCFCFLQFCCLVLFSFIFWSFFFGLEEGRGRGGFCPRCLFKAHLHKI